MKTSKGIIGAGQLGNALIRHFIEKNEIEWVLARKGKSLERLRNIGDNITIFNNINEIDTIPDIIIVAVNDKAITEVDKQLARKGITEKYICHSSGFLGSEILCESRKAGAKTASVHPYQTFYNYHPHVFNGISWGMDCPGEDKTFWTAFVESTGGKAIFPDYSDKHSKALYHCSAVAASNFLTAVISLSSEIATAAGIDPMDFVPAITRTTLQNNIDAMKENTFPLSGPIARGDRDAVKLHIEGLESFPELQKSYALTGLALAELSRKNGLLDEEKYYGICELLRLYSE